MSEDTCLYPFCGKTKGRSLYIRVSFPDNDGKRRTWEKVGKMCDTHLAQVVKQLKMEQVGDSGSTLPSDSEAIVTRSDNKGDRLKGEEEGLYDHGEG